MDLFQSPNKLTFLFYRFNQLVQTVWRRKFFFKALEQLHGSFSDIGAQKDFQMPEFFMPELLQKELWQRQGQARVNGPFCPIITSWAFFFFLFFFFLFLQGDQLNMTVFFWYFVKSDLSSFYVYSSIH